MAKKLFVPERVAANMKSDTPQTKIPTAIEKALPEQEENKNTENPENMDISALDRLPNPVVFHIFYRTIRQHCCIIFFLLTYVL